MGQKLTIEHFRKAQEFKPMQAVLEVDGKDPKYVYRLVENKLEAIRYRQTLGYEIVTEEGDATAGLGGSPDQRRIVAGELVLMRRAKELHELDRQARREKAREKQRGPIESFKGKAARFGVEVVDETKSEVAPLASRVPGDDEFEDDA